MAAETPFPALVAFLFHVQRGLVPAADMEHIEAIVLHGPSLAELAETDPWTLASAGALADRLLSAQPALASDEDEDEDQGGPRTNDKHDAPASGPPGTRDQLT